MTYAGREFMPLDRQLFGLTLSEAMAALSRKWWPQHTAKTVAKRWDLDPTTAANLIKGHASTPTITKAVRSEPAGLRWRLWMALGEAVIGFSYDQHLELLEAEAEDARRRAADRRAHVQRLEAFARSTDGLDSSAADFLRGPVARGLRVVGDDVGAHEGQAQAVAQPERAGR
jgi:hypothetical protein